jgi:hypothetical protein
MRFGVHRIVEVLGVVTVDGDQRQVADVDALRRDGGVHLAAVRFGLAHCLGRKLAGQIEARDGRFAGQLHRLLGIKAPGDSRLRIRPLARVTRHRRDDPVPMARARQIRRRNQAAHADTPVRRRDEGRASVDLHRAHEGLGAVLEDLLQPARVAPIPAALDGHAHAIAVHHAHHLARWQEYGLFLSLDAHEAEAGAIGADDAFGRAPVGRGLGLRHGMPAR